MDKEWCLSVLEGIAVAQKHDNPTNPPVKKLVEHRRQVCIDALAFLVSSSGLSSEVKAGYYKVLSAAK